MARVFCLRVPQYALSLPDILALIVLCRSETTNDPQYNKDHKERKQCNLNLIRMITIERPRERQPFETLNFTVTGRFVRCSSSTAHAFSLCIVSTVSLEKLQVSSTHTSKRNSQQPSYGYIGCSCLPLQFEAKTTRNFHGARF